VRERSTARRSDKGPGIIIDHVVLVVLCDRIEATKTAKAQIVASFDAVSASIGHITGAERPVEGIVSPKWLCTEMTYETTTRICFEAVNLRFNAPAAHMIIMMSAE